MDLKENAAGCYNFLTGIAPYSSGVVAMPGYEIVHVQLRTLTTLSTGLEGISQYLRALGRPIQALCALELRIPKPLSFDGFADFNGQYRRRVEKLNLLIKDENPIARTNIAPATGLLEQPVIYAFSYTVKTDQVGALPTFVVAGAGDLRDQSMLTADAIVHPGITTTTAMRAKAGTVMQVMQDRLQGLGVSWRDVSDINVYTAQPLASYLVDSILDPAAPAGRYGIRWHYSHPPIQGLAFEMNVRGVRSTLTLSL